MKLIKPFDLTQSDISNASILLDDYPLWASGAYVVGDRVLHTKFFGWYYVFECKADTSLEPKDLENGDTGQDNSWRKVGEPNRFKMFDKILSTKTVQQFDIDATITVSEPASGLAFLDLENVNQIRIKVNLDPVGSPATYDYDETFNLILDLSAYPWVDDFFFPEGQNRNSFVVTGLPTVTTGDYEIEIEMDGGTKEMSVGGVFPGSYADLGTTLHGTGFNLIDYSAVQIDSETGLISIEDGAYAKKVSAKTHITMNQVDLTQKVLKSLLNVPAVYITHEDLDQGIIYGYYLRADMRTNHENDVELDLTIEELSPKNDS